MNIRPNIKIIEDSGVGPGRRCVFDATPDLIAQLLQLPDGAHIDAVSTLSEAPGIVRFRIAGAGSEVHPGQILPWVRPTITAHYGDRGELQRVVITWPWDRGQTTDRQQTDNGQIDR